MTPTSKPLIAAALLLVSACSPVETWYKAGGTAGQSTADLTACRVEGVRTVPANTQIGVTPIRSTPPRTQCYGKGDKVRCHTVPGRIYGGQRYSYDANAPLRDDVVTQCMAGLGYRPVSLPACTASQKPAVLVDRGMPPLTPDSCAVPTRGGTVIVTPS